MNNFFGSDESFETIKSGAKQVGKVVSDQAKITAKIAGSQLGVAQNSEASPDNQQQAAAQQAAVQQANQQEFIDGLYGVSNQQNQNQTPNLPQLQNTVPLQVGDQSQLEETRKKLEDEQKKKQQALGFHRKNYYIPEFEEKIKKIEEQQKQVEEEKAQEQEQKKMDELEEKKKDEEVPLAVQMAAQRSEKFPGASG